MRANYLLQSQVALLNHWATYVRVTFRGAVPYLVGSVLTTGNFRDVDVRVILDDDRHDWLSSLVNVPHLNLAISLWGQKATGLPIDFQVQAMTAANEQFSGSRCALGIRITDVKAAG